MKTLKLQIGKTYRDRKGEVVRIVDKINPYGYHYQGSNGKWYTESGRFDVRVAKSSSDLIEEVPETSHTF